jgi:hypothetical protein
MVRDRAALGQIAATLLNQLGPHTIVLAAISFPLANDAGADERGL